LTGTKIKTPRYPHVSLYLAKPVVKALKEIALRRECKVHDILILLVRRFLEDNGYSFDALNDHSS